jgi:hypothetical protein
MTLFLINNKHVGKLDSFKKMFELMIAANFALNRHRAIGAAERGYVLTLLKLAIALFNLFNF